MHKVSIARKSRLLVLRDERTFRARKRLALRAWRKGGRPKFRNRSSHLHGARIARQRVVAPAVFNLRSNKDRNSLLRFLTNLKVACRDSAEVVIDFGGVKFLNPCGTLLFVAEIHRLREAYGKVCKLKATPPRHLVVHQLLQHIGLLAELGVRQKVPVSHERVTGWTFHRGTNVDITGLGGLQDRLNDGLGEDLAFDLLSAVQEAVTNAVHHAYIQPRGDSVNWNEPGWWLFAEQRDDGQVDLAVCDLGIGIRRTLPLTGTWAMQAIEKVLSGIGASTLDARHIKAALELGNTRTGQGNRGKGLHEMLELVKSAKSGGLRIMSDKGMFTLNGRSGVEKILDFNQSIMGTLVQWSFNAKTLNAQEAHDG